MTFANISVSYRWVQRVRADGSSNHGDCSDSSSNPLSLTAALQGVHPVPLDFVADPAELAVAVVQGEVLVEAAQHHREVLLLLASLPMPVSKQPLVGASEELSATLGAGDPDQGETPCSILPTDVLEAQKLKRLWPLSVFAPFDGCKTPKEQQPSFLLGQFQIELRKSFPQLALEVFRVSPELEASHKIIRETHQVCLALALCFEFLFKPQVEREVQVDVSSAQAILGRLVAFPPRSR